MNKKISLGVAICFMAIAAAITFTITMFFSLNVFNTKIANVDEREHLYKKLSEIDTYVRNQYLGDIDEENLLNYVARGYMVGIDDKYAAYMTQEEYKYYQQENEGTLVGIGTTARKDDSGYILIVDVKEASPAEAAGIQAGDLIVKVNEEDILTIGYTQAMSNIKGEEGTKVNLALRREGEDYSVELTRKNIQSSTIEYRPLGENGYIKISNFDDTTVDDFKYAVSDLKSQGVKGLIFDVRNNPGGLLDSVADVLDYLLPEGDLVSETNKKGETKVLRTSDSSCIELPMVVLVDGETASAAELFAADLRDFKVAELIGQTTYGKGIMQGAFPLEDGSAIKMTVGYFNPHSGVNFNGVGLKPDYEVALTTEQKLNFDTLDETSDPQLMKAIEVLNAKE
ncbi:S41 family peptidase [Fumia xinanensis]|uniref:S41 family peptidase n=1 Tax=Fumia xinanensis TaxID=2763659 RepID=A0A926I5F9_9FIRM|nr:S41 family peptidase [Fumia xinanensis]MBC8558825.1 S41 family peptidase [Fumia xinanensis]